MTYSAGGSPTLSVKAPQVDCPRVDISLAPSAERAKDVPYPAPSSEAVTRVMRGNRKIDTRPEVRVRSLLHQRGMRFRKQLLIVAGTVQVRPDIVFPRQRLAIFLDGCFWHCCPDHGNSPNTNSTYWSIKLSRNVERDRRVLGALTSDGWQALRIWEHVPVEEAADRIQAALERRKASDGV